MIPAHPALVLLVAAVAVTSLRGAALRTARVLGPLLALGTWGLLRPGVSEGVPVAGLELLGARVDALSSLFGLAMCGVTVLGGLYALHRRGTGEAAAALVYARARSG